MSDNVFGARCKSCGKVNYPPHCTCPGCRGDKFEPVAIEGEGKVLTYTDVYALAVDYVQRYLRLAVVELDMGVRAMGHLLDDDPRIGKRVKAEIGIVRQSHDREIRGLQFVPIE